MRNSEMKDYNQKTIINNNTLNDSFSSNHTIKNINQMVAEEVEKNNYINNLNNQNAIQTNSIPNNNEITHKTISTYINDNMNFINNQQNKSNLFQTFGTNNNIIPEEPIDSESEAYTFGFIKNLVNKEYILMPISQTNCVKLVTTDKDNRTISLKFPNNLDIKKFLLDCAYCNNISRN